jgi:hypothetical protein
MNVVENEDIHHDFTIKIKFDITRKQTSISSNEKTSSIYYSQLLLFNKRSTVEVNFIFCCNTCFSILLNSERMSMLVDRKLLVCLSAFLLLQKIDQSETIFAILGLFEALIKLYYRLSRVRGPNVRSVVYYELFSILKGIEFWKESSTEGIQ